MCECARERESRSGGALKGGQEPSADWARKRKGERQLALRVGEKILQCGSLNVACCCCVSFFDLFCSKESGKL